MKIILDTQMKKKRLHFEAELVTAIINPIGYNDVITLIEMVGSTTAQQAIWAHLVSHKDADNIYTTDLKLLSKGKDKTLQLKPKTKFATKTIGDNFIIMDISYNEKKREYFVGGSIEVPPPDFFDSFRINVPNIPVLPEWETQLWKLGISFGGVEPLTVYSNHGLQAWKLNQNGWEDKIKEEVVKWQD